MKRIVLSSLMGLFFVIAKGQTFEPLDQRILSVKYGYYQNNMMRVQNTFSLLPDGVGLTVAYQWLLKDKVDSKFATGWTGGLSYTTEWVYLGASLGSLNSNEGSNQFEMNMQLGTNIRLGEHAAFNIGGLYSKQNGVGAEVGITFLF